MAHVPSKTRKKVEWLLRRAEGALLSDAVLSREGDHLDWPDALQRLADEREAVVALGLEGRFDALGKVIDSRNEADRATYLEQHGVGGVTRFHSGSGKARIYCMSVETFPHHVNNIYVLCEEGHRILFDCGSGSQSSRRGLALGFAIVRDAFKEDVRYGGRSTGASSPTRTSDHFGGANLVKEETRAHSPRCTESSDARVLSCFNERIIIASKDCDSNT